MENLWWKSIRFFFLVYLVTIYYTFVIWQIIKLQNNSFTHSFILTIICHSNPEKTMQITINSRRLKTLVRTDLPVDKRVEVTTIKYDPDSKKGTSSSGTQGLINYKTCLSQF